MNLINDIKSAALTTAHDVEAAIKFLPHAVSLIETALKDEPELKSLIVTLVGNASAVLASMTTAVSSDGLNLAADAAALTAAETFFKWLKGTFIPDAENIYSDLATDVK